MTESSQKEQTFTLRQGETEVVIGAVSAAIRSLRVGNREVIPADTEGARKHWFSGVTLAPWPNRLADARWSFEGKELVGEINDRLGHALHGLVASRTFDLVRQADDSVVLSFMLGEDAVYPFEVIIEVEYQAKPDGVDCRISAINLDAARVPVALGAHPYLPFTEECELSLPAASVLEVDDRKIPTGESKPALEFGVVVGQARPMLGFNADDCFTDLSLANGESISQIRYPDGSVTEVWQGAALPYTMVFTLREFPWQAGRTPAIGIEPQSAPANALASGKDLTWLDSGQSCSVSWGIRSVSVK